MAQTPPPPPPPSSLADLGQSLLQQVQAAGGVGGTSFIGLPTNATVSAKQLEAQVLATNPQGQPYSTTDVVPRYKSGAQWLPVLGGASPQEISTLQLQLSQAGLLTTFQKGNWDKNSQDAFEQLLGSANNAGTDWQTQLNTEMNSTTMTIDPVTGLPVAKRKGVSALKLSYTNPDDVATTAQNVAQQYIGRPLSQSELQRFQSVWQSQERGYQTAEASASAVGGAVTQNAGIDTEAQKFAQSVDPTAYQAQQALGLVQHLDGMLKGNVNETVTSKQQLGSEIQ